MPLPVYAEATPVPVYSHDSLVSVSNTLKKLSLGQQLLFLEDETHSLTLDQVREAWSQGKFEWRDQEVLNFGLNQSDFWFYVRFRLDADAEDEVWQLSMENTSSEKVTLYLISEDGLIQQRETGNHTDYKDRDVLDSVHVVNVPFTTAGEYQAWIRVQLNGPAMIPLTFWNEKERERVGQIRYIMLSLFYGSLIVMVFYNFCIYLGTKSKSYLYYVIYVVNIGVFLLCAEGVVVQLFIPQHVEWLRTLINITSVMLIGSICTFVRSFLHTRTRQPTLDRFLKLGVYISAVGLLLSFEDHLAVSYVVVIAPFTSLVILIASVNSLARGYTEARFFLLGWLALIFATSYQCIGFMGFLPWNSLVRYSLHIGSFIEIVLIALALADRINKYKEQKERAEIIAKKELIEKNATLRQSNRLKDEFIATISHELRTPLNGIIGSIELADSEVSEEERKKLNSVALESSFKLGGIIDDILALSEVLSGNAKLVEKSFNAQELVNSLYERLAPQANEKEVKVNFAHTSHVPAVLVGDPSKVKIAIYHVLSNAIKFSPCGGEVNVTAEVITQSDQNITVRLSVTDKGPGIENDRLDVLFEAFRQADNSYSRAHGGLGIGLTLISNIMKLLGGNIDVSSAEGVGTVFALEFPFKKATGVGQEYVRPNAGSLNHVKKILVVEDNLVNQKVLMGILKKLGYEVDCAINGKIAVSKCENESFDLVFMDCQMPEMNGFEATEKIRQSTNQNNLVPIIAVTANATEKDKEHCYQVGMNDFIKKPVNKTIIQKILGVEDQVKSA